MTEEEKKWTQMAINHGVGKVVIEVRRELLEKVRKDFKDVVLINVDKYINRELKFLDKKLKNGAT